MIITTNRITSFIFIYHLLKMRHHCKWLSLYGLHNSTYFNKEPHTSGKLCFAKIIISRQPEAINWSQHEQFNKSDMLFRITFWPVIFCFSSGGLNCYLATTAQVIVEASISFICRLNHFPNDYDIRLSLLQTRDFLSYLWILPQIMNFIL